MKNLKIFPYNLQSSQVVSHRYTLQHDFISDAVDFYNLNLELVNSNICKGINYLYFRENKYPIDFFIFLSVYFHALTTVITCNLRVELSDHCFSCNRVSGDKIVVNMYMTPDYAKSF